jgi:hypothetical protein
LLLLVFISVLSCADLPRLYDTLEQLLFNSIWDGNALAWDCWEGWEEYICCECAGKLPEYVVANTSKYRIFCVLSR